MEQLSKGFTKNLYATFSRCSSNGGNANCTHKEIVQSFVHQWPEPTFQIIDVQRFSKNATQCYSSYYGESHNLEVANSQSSSELFSCFYLASSDGEGIFWVLIPPRSKLEEVISNFAVDVGYCMKLREYSVLIAMNGRPVVVALEMSFSRNPLSLQGTLVVDDHAFHLSPHALQDTHTTVPSSSSFTTLSTCNKCTQTQNYTGELTGTHINNSDDNDNDITTSGGKSPELESIMKSSVEVDLAQLLQHPEYALSNWCITLRLLWKGEDRAIERGSRFYRKMSCLESTSAKGTLQRQVSTTAAKYSKNANLADRVKNNNNKIKMQSFANCNCLVIDRNGDGIACTFYATVEFLSEIDVNDCLQIVNPEIVWGTSSENAVSQLRIYERNIYCNHADQLPTVLPKFPHQASRFVGSAGNNIMPIASILAECGIDDVVSVIGKVIVVSDEVQVHTKRGRVMRRTISLEDLTQRGCLIDLTLWGNLASKVEVNEGEVWTVVDCTVREFMRRKTLSSRASTALALMNVNNVNNNYSKSITDGMFGNYNEDMTIQRQTTFAEREQKNVNESDTNEQTESHHTLHYDTHTQMQNTSVIIPDGNCLKSLDVSTPQLSITVDTINEQAPLLLRICEIGLCESRLNALQTSIENELSTKHNQAKTIEMVRDQLRETYISVTLSDGNGCLSTITQVSNMVALWDDNGDADEDADNIELEMRARLLQTNNLSLLITKLNQELVGYAILAWVSPIEHSNTLILTRCRHVNFAACAGVVLNEIEEYMRK